MKFRYAVFFIPALAACTPTEMASTPRSITMSNVMKVPSSISEATRQAQQHCSQYNRSAEMIPDDTGDGMVTFRCVDN